MNKILHVINVSQVAKFNMQYLQIPTMSINPEKMNTSNLTYMLGYADFQMKHKKFLQYVLMDSFRATGINDM